MEHRLKELSRNSTGELSILCARLFPWCRVLTRLGYVPWRIDKSSSANDQKLAFRKTKLRISLFWLHLMENILFRITVLATFYFPFFFLFSFSSDIFQRQFQIRFSSLKEFCDTSSSDSKKASKNVQTWFALLISLIKYLYIFFQAFFESEGTIEYLNKTLSTCLFVYRSLTKTPNILPRISIAIESNSKLVTNHLIVIS